MSLTRKASAGLLLAMFLVGCGGGDPTSVGDSTDSGTPTVLLLQKGDLPSAARAEAIPEPCSPVAVLEAQGARVVVSPLYKLRGKSVAEAVGIAASAEKAAAALEGLQSGERMSCIRSAMEAFGPQEGESVSVESPVRMAEGQEGSLVRLLEIDAGSEPVNSTVVASFREGRCVATFLFLFEGGDSGQALIDDLTGHAYDLLADAQSTCR
jgi:hypothetical protein